MNGIDQQSVQQPVPTQIPPTTPTQLTPAPSSFFDRNKVKIIIIVIFIFLVILVIVILLLFQGFGGQRSALPSLQQATGSATKSATPAELTADWKTYANSDFGFHLLYPPDWSIKEENYKNNPQASDTQAQPVVSWTSSSGGFTKPVYTSISYYKPSSPVNLDTFVSERLKNLSFTKDLPKQDALMVVGGLSGTMVIYSAKDTNGQVNIYAQVFVPKDDKMWQIIGSVAKEGDSANLFRPFNQLLATFRFVFKI